MRLITGVKGFFNKSAHKNGEAPLSDRTMSASSGAQISGSLAVRPFNSETDPGQDMDELGRPRRVRKQNPIKSSEKKLPKNFANKVLDYELKLDSGRFDIETIDKLMQLYGQAVEYYSGKNDEKYMYFTERIQNTLLRPEILKVVKE